MSALSHAFAQKLARRRPLAVAPARGVAIKRNVHEFVIGCDADRFAAAFADELGRDGARFGLVEVRRPEERAGRAFAPGERFHGCVRLAALADRWRRRRAHAIARGLCAALARTRLGAWLENAALSDYAEIVELEPRRVVYRYLAGTPMAGTSTFLVEPLDGARCRLTVIFEYQELGGLAISVLHRFGVQMHDEVTLEQARAACRRAGAPLVATTVRSV
jgi:hypothetical protein